MFGLGWKGLIALMERKGDNALGPDGFTMPVLRELLGPVKDKLKKPFQASFGNVWSNQTCICWLYVKVCAEVSWILDPLANVCSNQI